LSEDEAVVEVKILFGMMLWTLVVNLYYAIFVTGLSDGGASFTFAVDAFQLFVWHFHLLSLSETVLRIPNVSACLCWFGFLYNLSYGICDLPTVFLRQNVGNWNSLVECLFCLSEYAGVLYRFFVAYYYQKKLRFWSKSLFVALGVNNTENATVSPYV